MTLANLIHLCPDIQYNFLSHFWFLQQLCSLPPQELHNIDSPRFHTTIASSGIIQFDKWWSELKVFKVVLQLFVHHFPHFTPRKIIHHFWISKIWYIFLQILIIGPVSSNEKKSWTGLQEEQRQETFELFWNPTVFLSCMNTTHEKRFLAIILTAIFFNHQ